MDIQVNLSGMQELQKALDDANSKFYELHKAVTEIQYAFAKIGMEINQPQLERGKSVSLCLQGEEIKWKKK